jgi:glycosyltransferase involved in cell wall biosynthesis
MPTPVRPRIAILSPFIDKSHGTERVIAEQIERLNSKFEIHLYSSRVADIDLTSIAWHRVWIPPGPHLFGFLWWLAANRLRRTWHRLRGLRPDLIYSPGINCLDADLIAVHIVFAEFWDQVKDELKFRNNPMKTWPRLLHRRLYYSLIEFLERRVYRRADVALTAVSEKTALAVTHYYGRTAPVGVIYNGIDYGRFNPQRVAELRASARGSLGLTENAIAVLLVGNDWKKKGLPCLLEAAGLLHDPRLRILVAGRDIEAPYKLMISRLGLAEQVAFLPLRPDVEFYYAAADIYAGPSLDDSFALPPAEAMACGLPVITTRSNGGSTIMHHGEDGLILEDPADAKTLSQWLDRLANDAAWRATIGAAATITAAKYTWEHSAQQLGEVIDSIIQKKRGYERSNSSRNTDSEEHAGV